MKKIRSILIIVVSLFIVSCGQITSLLNPEDDSVVNITESENQEQNNEQYDFYFEGTVYSDSYDMFEHAVYSYSGLIEVDFEYPTTNTGLGAEGEKCIRADFSDQGEFGVFNFYTEGSPLDLTTYTAVSFRAKAESNVSIQIGLDSNGGAWNEYNDGVTSKKWVDIDTEWREYTVMLDSLVSDAYTGGAHFISTDFDLSQVTSVFKVDDISDPDIPFYIDAIYYSNVNIEKNPRDFTMQVEWGQLTDEYVNNVKLINPDGVEVMQALGSMQLGQVTSTPVSDSYFGVGNALRYVHSGVDDWGGVFLHVIETNNELPEDIEFKVAVKGDIPPAIENWTLEVNSGNDSYQPVNILDYEVDSEDEEWRLFVISAAVYHAVELDSLYSIGLWNPRGIEGPTIETSFEACDLIIDIAINANETIPVIPESDNSYTYQVEWGQLSDTYENSISIVDENGSEVMTVAGSMQSGQVTTSPVTDSYFGTGNALNYVHDGLDSQGGVFFDGIVTDNDLPTINAFKIAVKGNIPPELTCWGLTIESEYGLRQDINFMLYEVKSADPEWRLFEIPVTEDFYIQFYDLKGLGLWNPKRGVDVTYEGGYVGCDLIVDLAIK